MQGLPTADLADKAGLDVSKLPTEKNISVVDPQLNFRNFGGKTAFSGPITTIKAYESNPLVRIADPALKSNMVIVAAFA